MSTPNRSAAPLSLGQVLGRIRSAQGITLQDAAKAIGVSPSAMCLWDAGKRNPTLGHTVAYARFLSRRLVAVHDGRVVAEGEELANIAGLREAASASTKRLARLVGVSVAAIWSVERLAGPGMGVCACQQYLGALGYQVGLAVAA